MGLRYEYLGRVTPKTPIVAKLYNIDRVSLGVTYQVEDSLYTGK